MSIIIPTSGAGFAPIGRFRLQVTILVRFVVLILMARMYG